MPDLPRPSADDADSYVGMSVVAARKRAADNGWALVREVDETNPVITADWRADRVNFFVEEDRVARCWFH